MAAPAGPCEWCGGPQQWTFIASEMYTRCISGCQPLPFAGLVPPPHEQPTPDLSRISVTEKELSEMGGVYPVRGDAAKESKDDDLPF